MSRKIPNAGPWLTEREFSYVMDAAKNSFLTGNAKYQRLFEKAMAEYLGVKFAVTLPSCTSSIHTGLATLGVGNGDEVIVPDLTWVGSSAPISYLGATTVFADADETWCISPNSLEECITPKTKAIITVDLYGNIPKMDEINKIAKKYGIPIIEDAAEAIGSEYQGRKAGSLGDMGVFSFHGSKTVTAGGEGGMLVTDNEETYRRAMILREHGRHPGDKSFWVREVGFKYRLSDMQAAMGLAQLERVDELVKRKIEIFRRYQQRLATLKGVTLNPDIPGVKNSYWMTTAIFDQNLGLTKEEFMELTKDSMDIRPFFYPLSSQPAYSKTPEAIKARERNKFSYGLHNRGVNLPSALSLTNDEIDTACETLEEIVKNRQ